MDYKLPQKRINSRGSVALPLIILAVLLIGMAVAVYLIRQRQVLRSKADTQGSARVFFSPSAISSLGLSGTFSVDVNLRSDTSNITGADVKVNYDCDLDLVSGGQGNQGEFKIPDNINDSDKGLKYFDSVIIPGQEQAGVDLGSRTVRYVGVDKGQTPITTGRNVDLGSLTFKPNSGSSCAAGASRGTVRVGGAQVVAAGLNGTLSVDTSSTAAYSVAAPTPTPTSIPTPAPVVGDCADNNKCVNTNDYTEALRENSGTSNNKACDFTGPTPGVPDGTVDWRDLSLIQYKIDNHINACQ